MSEVINQVAILTAKPEAFDELVAELANITRNVQEHEPEAIVYYAYSIPQANEVVVVERYTNQAALDKHHAAPYLQELIKKAPALLAKPSEVKAGAHLLQDSAQVVRL
ncbi:hypothetical protein LT330_001681 [Penicillium expansum]|uniref:Dimeric alpha-beta barrel n=1 Tax=Penicillium expansum TaxID=27334 RepID=A0A0A2KEG2_PENEN|nr:Dimeric alpha-beta barrel [Penicillium expansum]KAJ5505675.1 Dimeric alpha-beta barrel [Penicillium expansum]KAK4865058.1 hypothetical protein LT330_001681 [Penicillium expansum]KGO37870.1 Dimeric alpha-beta barrel [Penicillium expansum]KGO49779.1 Dimeric alpha-beta barrel [Penicillium expansum]KGO65353.1 Dimeric alpha-beta barrel [Penicillium expansum]